MGNFIVRRAVRLQGQGLYGNTALPAHFCCELKNTLKSRGCLKVSIEKKLLYFPKYSLYFFWKTTEIYCLIVLGLDEDVSRVGPFKGSEEDPVPCLSPTFWWCSVNLDVS